MRGHRNTGASVFNIFDNIKNVIFNGYGSNFYYLNFHLLDSSKVEYVMLFLTATIIFASYKKLPREMFWYSLALWCFPILFKNLTSFSRFFSVIFPAFIFMALVFRRLYYILLLIFAVLYMYAFIRIIQWLWVG